MPPPAPDPTALAVEAAKKGVAAGEAAAQEGESNANLAYSLSEQILKDNQFEAIIPLDLLVAKIIAEGLRAYSEVAQRESDAMKQVADGYNAARQQAQTTFEKLDKEFAQILGSSGARTK